MHLHLLVWGVARDEPTEISVSWRVTNAHRVVSKVSDADVARTSRMRKGRSKPEDGAHAVRAMTIGPAAVGERGQPGR